MRASSKSCAPSTPRSRPKPMSWRLSSMSPRLSEVRHGRNFIRSGDLVRVKPSRSGHHDGFAARFLFSEEGAHGLFYALQELDEHGAVQRFRFVRPEMVRRLARKAKR